MASRLWLVAARQYARHTWLGPSQQLSRARLTCNSAVSILQAHPARALSSNSTTSSTDATAPKKRGRPAKVKIADANPATPPVSVEAPGTDTAPKKRGRPRKAETPLDDATTRAARQSFKEPPTASSAGSSSSSTTTTTSSSKAGPWRGPQNPFAHLSAEKLFPDPEKTAQEDFVADLSQDKIKARLMQMGLNEEEATMASPQLDNIKRVLEEELKAADEEYERQKVELDADLTDPSKVNAASFVDDSMSSADKQDMMEELGLAPDHMAALERDMAQELKNESPSGGASTSATSAGAAESDSDSMPKPSARMMEAIMKDMGANMEDEDGDSQFNMKDLEEHARAMPGMGNLSPEELRARISEITGMKMPFTAPTGPKAAPKAPGAQAKSSSQQSSTSSASANPEADPELEIPPEMLPFVQENAARFQKTLDMPSWEQAKGEVGKAARQFLMEGMRRQGQDVSLIDQTVAEQQMTDIFQKMWHEERTRYSAFMDAAHGKPLPDLDLSPPEFGAKPEPPKSKSTNAPPTGAPNQSSAAANRKAEHPAQKSERMCWMLISLLGAESHDPAISSDPQFRRMADRLLQFPTWVKARAFLAELLPPIASKVFPEGDPTQVDELVTLALDEFADTWEQEMSPMTYMAKVRSAQQERDAEQKAKK